MVTKNTTKQNSRLLNFLLCKLKIVKNETKNILTNGLHDKFQMTEDPQPEDAMIPSEMTNLQAGPMGPIVKAVYDKEPILIALRSNRKLYGYIKAVDRHWNMILEGVIEVTPTPQKPGQPPSAPIQRRINRLFLRGDNVICVYPNPKPMASN